MNRRTFLQSVGDAALAPPNLAYAAAHPDIVARLDAVMQSAHT